MSNLKQLQLAWMLYAEDNAGRLTSCVMAGVTLLARPDAWVVGNMQNTAEAIDTTLLLGGALGNYAQTEKLYRCENTPRASTRPASSECAASQ